MPDFDWDTASPRARDAAIAQHVMDRKVKWQPNPDGEITPWIVTDEYDGAWVEMGDYDCEEWSYTTTAAADYTVLERVRTEKWIDEREDVFNRFWTHLAEILRSRDPYYRDTVNQRELYYMSEYRPGDFSHAAWLALRETAAATQETTHERPTARS